MGSWGEGTKSSALTMWSASECLPPTSVSVDNPMAAPGEETTLRWSGTVGGTHNTIAAYKIYRATAEDGTYTLFDDIESAQSSGSCVVTAPEQTGERYYYKVAVVGSAGYESEKSAAVSVGANADPDAPTVTGSGTAYNPQPRLLIQAGSDTEGEMQTLAATGWTFSRASVEPGGKAVARKSTAVSGSDTVSVTVTQTDPYGASSSATASISRVQPVFDEITAGRTAIQAAHMVQLRTMLDNLCDYYGLARTEWAETITAGRTSTLGWTAHVLEIQQTIARIAAAVNAWDAESSVNNVILPTMIIPGTPSADVMNQLRNMIMLL